MCIRDSYNYQNGTWAFNEDSFTTFGYYQNVTGETWASTEYTWEEAGFAWNSGVQQQGYRNIVAGNQQGYVLIIDPQSSSNAPALSINNMSVVLQTVTITSINHNLTDQDY